MFLNTPRDDDSCTSPGSLFTGISAMDTAELLHLNRRAAGLHHSLGTAAFQHSSASQQETRGMLSCLHHQSWGQTPILCIRDGHWISLTPLCFRCSKSILRWCPRNRPGKTKIWFIILLPVTISSCPVAAKPTGPAESPGAQGGGKGTGKASPKIQPVQCFHPCSFPWSFGGQQESSHPPVPRSRESHQSCSTNSSCSEMRRNSKAEGRGENKSLGAGRKA